MTIRVRFQPIFNVQEGSLLGFESTMLGPNGENGLVLFEKAGTKEAILELDRFAMSMSLKRGLPLLDRGQFLFINAHPISVCSGFIFDTNKRLENVVLEITEEATLNAFSKISLEPLAKAGIAFAIDDYGKQNSNLDRLSLDWFHPKFMKLDREFCSRLNQFKVRSLVRHTLSMCNELGIHLIVEGVETADQKDILIGLGVKFLQGYHLGMPTENPITYKKEERFAL